MADDLWFCSNTDMLGRVPDYERYQCAIVVRYEHRLSLLDYSYRVSRYLGLPTAKARLAVSTKSDDTAFVVLSYSQTGCASLPVILVR